MELHRVVRLLCWNGFPLTMVRQFGRQNALRMADGPAPDASIGGTISR
jgi:hypothetical protein